MQSPEGYILSGGAMLAVGAFYLYRSLRKPSAGELISARVVDTKLHEGGDYKVSVVWTGVDGAEKRGHVVVSSGDLPTKGSTLEIMPARYGTNELRVARLKYRIGPAIGIMIFGAVGLAMGLSRIGD